MSFIELKGVKKSYGTGTATVTALKGIDLMVSNGEFVSLMGASGSGKSTLLNILGCLDVPTSGSYLFSGIHVERLNRNQRAYLRRQYIGFVFQSYNLLPRTTAIENVELPLIYRGLNKKQRLSLAFNAIKRVGLEGREHHTPSELSGGEQQRVAIARAIVTEPHVLFADEPTGNLDTKTSNEIMELFKRLNETMELTIIMVTHEPDIAGYARRHVLMKDGEIISDSTEVNG
ncbi:MAG: ABC transporter ATP-binding protein [Thermodesulfovibrionia bacterium]